MKEWVTPIKPYLRWLILGGTLFFLLHTLRQHWQEVTTIQIEGWGWGLLAAALLVTLAAHVWAGWVWGWILEELGYDALGGWSISAYLKTNIAKYLPGNVWHFYGRVMAAKSVGVPLEGAAVSVVMEPLLMAIAALVIAFASNQRLNIGLQLMGLGVGLALVHPRVMNPLLSKIAAAKRKLASTYSESSTRSSSADSSATTPIDLPVDWTSDAASPSSALSASHASSPTSHQKPVFLKKYPILPLIGELIFLVLRGAGFIGAVIALHSVEWADVLPLLSAFSVAWMLGLVVPGAPGGIGVFEATVLALLNNSVPPGPLLGAVAFYRLVNTLAEAIGAGLAWSGDRLSTQT
ncbi:MAG: lysylphosphatidylglycerol synthase domain-containing protein [Cyanobacteria bacterium J06633_2]